LKVRLDLRDDPAVAGIARRLGLDEDHVVGKLVRFWSWANRQSTDGNAPVTLLYIDRHVGAPGFCAAMIAEGWLEVTGEAGVRIPKWDRHNSQGAKQRALTAIRVAAHRKRKCNGACVTESLPEKRRGESITPPTPPASRGGGAPARKETRAQRADRAAAEQAARQAQGRAARAEELRRQCRVEGALQPGEVAARLRAARRKAQALTGGGGHAE